MRNPFKKAAPAVPLTSDAYTRWLRARSPQPLSFFLGLGSVDQEALALLGDEYSEDLAIAAAFAGQNPAAAAMGIGHDDPESIDLEESLVNQLGSAILARGVDPAPQAQTAPQGPPAKRPITMGGTTKRQAQRDLDARQARDDSRVLLGKRPDALEAIE